ncbi:MAG TPA: hypothetical protein PKB14_01745 [Rubrivivax sp.]|nr:hypothetical protein [Rubrivivax sp.]
MHGPDFDRRPVRSFLAVPDAASLSERVYACLAETIARGLRRLS